MTDRQPEKFKMSFSHHLYEVVLESPQMWLKVQASCRSGDQATSFFEHRFGGHAPHLAERPDLVCVTFSFQVPKRLSECSEYIFNWEDIKGDLPTGWDVQEFRVADGAYPWCDTLSEDCDCHGAKGRLDATYCSSFGSHDESAKRASKSPNVRHAENVKWMRQALVDRQQTSREARDSRPNVQPHTPAPEGMFCQIDRHFHAYSEQVKQTAQAHLAAVSLQMKAAGEHARRSFAVKLPMLKEYFLQQYQSRECAERYVAGLSDIPDVIYKYIPIDNLCKGAPRTLRATQVLALNDDMECNIVVENNTDMRILDFLDLVKSELQEHLDIRIRDEELLERALRYGNMRLSPFFQQYLNQRVGIVSLTTDLLVPTMWSHYARNTGIVVGYDTEVLRGLGFDLRPVQYSEFPPRYTPARDETIRMDVPDRESIERNRLAGIQQAGISLLASADIAQMGAGWKVLSRMLFIKGRSWEYEKEIRLLVDLQETGDTGKTANSWPVKVIDVPPGCRQGNLRR